MKGPSRIRGGWLSENLSWWYLPGSSELRRSQHSGLGARPTTLWDHRLPLKARCFVWVHVGLGG